VSVARTAAVAALALGLAGCTESRPYPNLPEKNLQVRTATDGGRVVLEVHSLDRSCTANYEGFVALDKPLVELGLPSDKPAVLVFEFQRAGRSAEAPTRKEVHLLPRAGKRYEMRVAYKESIYDFELRELDPRTGTDREIDTRRRC
jgi:hypothetical protein